jgi:murein L,D-transpeptidase YcbB/YkuD
VSDRPEGPRREPVPPDEDDWFATPDDWFSPQGTTAPAGEPDEPLWLEDVDEEPPPPGPPGLGQRQVTVVVAVVAIVAVIAVGILAVRWIGGSDDTTTPPTTPVTTTPTTTPTTTATTTATTTSTTTAETTTTGTVTAVPAGQTLRPGMTGSSVLALQEALTQLGYDPGGADGNYGNGTTQAVKEFQAAQGLTQDGVAGPATLTAVNEQLAKG